MADYIERTALRDALYADDAITMQGVKILNQFPAADVAPVKPELKKAVGLLNAYYEKGLKNPIVRDPLAWALFQTWKTVNRGDRA